MVIDFNSVNSWAEYFFSEDTTVILFFFDHVFFDR